MARPRAGVAEQARARRIETVVLEAAQDLAALAGEAAAAGADALGMAGETTSRCMRVSMAKRWN